VRGVVEGGLVADFVVRWVVVLVIADGSSGELFELESER
jgi:hypothetical protein